jgi:hypothetical protein
VTKGFTQREYIDYNEAFSPVSCKNSLLIIMVLVTHYNLELHQMDVNMTFLNGDLLENVYLAQPKGFAVKEKEHMRCHMKKCIYGLNQASSQWYLKFNENRRNFGRSAGITGGGGGRWAGGIGGGGGGRRATS